MNSKYYLGLLAFICTVSCSLFSQSIAINATGAQADQSSGLDVNFNDRGFLVPRLSTVQRDAIAAPAVGLEIYNTTLNCLQVFYPTSGWLSIACDCVVFPVSTFTNTFGSTSTPVTFTPTTPGMTYVWQFQSGTPALSNSASPQVAWTTAGTYNVDLTVTDPAGCSSTSSSTVTITNCVSGGNVTFSNCTATLNNGPTQAQCNTAYTGSALAGAVTVTAGIQTWTVPLGVCQVVINAKGAQGGSTNGGTGGLGASITGTFAVSGGEVLKILVGQAGGPQISSTSVGGGGGSYVVGPNNTPWVVAGGGGGANGLTNGTEHGTIVANGNNGYSQAYPLNFGTGGVTGNGATFTGTGPCSGNGGGFLTDGQSVTCSGTNSYGKSFANGGAGGTSTYALGGFGGGGAGGNAGAGGGGGYSGGGGNYHYPGNGGGGGSFNGGTSPINTAQVQSSHGSVNITW